MKPVAICICMILSPVVVWGADPQAEMAKLKGKWQVTAMELRGMKLPAESLGPLKLAVLELGDGKLAIRVGDKALHEGSFKIDAKASPKTIEGTLMANPVRGKKDNRPAIGIYEIDGDTLRICFGAPGGGKAPKEFKTSEDGDGSTLVTYQRVK